MHQAQAVTPRIVKTGTHYRQTLAEIRRLALASPRRGSAASDKLELLTQLARDYEALRLSKSCPGPIAAIRMRMDERGLKQKDLVPLLGGKNRVSEILGGKRALTVAMIRALNKALDIPAEILIREPVASALKSTRRPR